MMKDKFSRREFLKTTAGMALAVGISHGFGNASGAESEIDISVVKSESPDRSVIAAIESLGGIGKFVKSGDVVLIKPNMAFPNPPGWGNTTNPDVVLAMVKLCMDAGARLILIIDNPMGDPDRCLKLTGVASACEKLGSKSVRVSMETEQRDYKEVKLEKAGALEKTEVHKTLLKADVFINMPVAKSHSATGVSLGMKNLMGLIWDRKYLHQDIDLHQGIADLSTFIKPSLIVLDATRVLTTRGPEGPGRTENLNKIVAGSDPVAVDSYAVKISQWNNRSYEPKDVKHIAEAHNLGLGEMDLGKLSIKELLL
jgi:uncharacterized protein (DUF362 family)